jgi:phosphatidylglycerophosphate synthase
LNVTAEWRVERPVSPAAECPPALDRGESARDARHPLSRWYLLPLAGAAASTLSKTSVRPWQVTALGFALSACAAAGLVAGWPAWLPAGLVLAAWFCDRLDGRLARRQGTQSSLGAWLDANLDELSDIGLHAALACAAARAIPGPLPWILLTAFVAGKYLFLHSRMDGERNRNRGELEPSKRRQGAGATSFLRRMVNLPANADIRVHLLVLAVATQWFVVELAVVAAYYNLRWLGRYAVVIRQHLRKGGAP